MRLPRLRGRLRLTSSLVTLLAALLALAGCGSSDAPAAPASGVGTVIDRPVPASIGALRLHDADGHTTSLDAFHGKTLVVSDSMTLCSEDCPLDTANVAAAARAADAAGLTGKVEFLTITVDPVRDDARHLTAYRKLYDPDHDLPNWQLLTGSQATITQLWKYFGVYWKKVPEYSPPDHDWLTGKPLSYDIEHADEVLMFDPQGVERYVVSGHAHVLAPSRVPTRMRAFLSRQGRRHLDRPGAATWTAGDVVQGIGWLTGHHVPGP